MRNLVTPPPLAARYVEVGQWDDTTLASRVRSHAASAGSRVAVVDRKGARRRTYAELARDAAALGGAMRDMGVGAGDVVSLQLPNCYETVLCAVAAQSIGAVINPLLPDYRRKELGHVFTKAAPKLVITPDSYRAFRYSPLIDEVRDTAGSSTAHLAVEVEGGESDFTALVERYRDGHNGTVSSVDASAVSELIFTSGTEAEPKAIMHTEQTANFSVRAAYSHLAMSDEDVVWVPSPVGHSTGFNYGIRLALYHGLKLVLQDRWDASDAVELIAKESCTYTLAATTFLQDLVDQLDGSREDLSTFSRFGCGGAPVPSELIDAAGRYGIGVLRLYGSTEVLVATWNNHTTSPTRLRGTDGCALPGVEVQVRDHGATCEVSEPGELFVRGPNTCVGFFHDAERTAATFDGEGWVRTGDLTCVDADGYLTVVGRKKEIIIRGGMNIAPREIEDTLTRFPEIERAAIVGLPDARLGERACACVVLRAGARLDFASMVERLSAAGLAKYKLPEQLELVSHLPMTASGKVQKHELLAQITNRPVRRARRGIAAQEDEARG